MGKKITRLGGTGGEGVVVELYPILPSALDVGGCFINTKLIFSCKLHPLSYSAIFV
jgi:hypothetical protein